MMNACARPMAAPMMLVLSLALAAFAGDAPSVSGGVGADARAARLAQEHEDNLKLVTAGTSGDYLASVAVVIERANRERVIETTMVLRWGGSR
jgi:hypothetical protein